MICGPVILTLSGIPDSIPSTLIHAIIHQIQLTAPNFTMRPEVFYHRFEQKLSTFISINALQSVTGFDFIQVLSACFEVDIYLYSGDTRSYYPSSARTSDKTIPLHIYYFDGKYDSVISIDWDNSMNFNPPMAPFVQRNSLRICTWNISGAADEAKRIMIDFELCREKIQLACVQETHLRSSKLESMHYIWLTGSQYQTRAWRGLGFLVCKSFYPYVKEVKFITPNIGFLRFRLPTMRRACVVVNIHKFNEGSLASSLETGKNRGAVIF